MGNGNLLQTTLFGPPEPVTSYGKDVRGRGADLPVPSERELLWPARILDGLVEQGLSPDQASGLLERLYGDIPRRTRLRTDEVCRRLRCDTNTVYRLRESGSLPAVDVSAGSGLMAEWRFYRGGLVAFLVAREFGGEVPSRTDASHKDATMLARAVARARV